MFFIEKKREKKECWGGGVEHGRRNKKWLEISMCHKTPKTKYEEDNEHVSTRLIIHKII